MKSVRGVKRFVRIITSVKVNLHENQINKLIETNNLFVISVNTIYHKNTLVTTILYERNKPI